MLYLGSKSRIAKKILPIMVEAAVDVGTTSWVEPFVGGGNLIDKVPTGFSRYGFDLNPHTIKALKDIRDNPHELPDKVTEEEYQEMLGQEARSITSWVRFVCSFSGKFEGGYARNSEGRNYAAVGKRNALRQSPNLQGVHLSQRDYREIKPENSLIYCDPPYSNTTGYKTGVFDHEEFFQWCREMAKSNVVFVSEYQAPEDFEEVWTGEIKTTFDSNRTKSKKATEKLFRVRGEK